jgi:hypothetical protein
VIVGSTPRVGVGNYHSHRTINIRHQSRRADGVVSLHAVSQPTRRFRIELLGAQLNDIAYFLWLRLTDPPFFPADRAK